MCTYNVFIDRNVRVVSFRKGSMFLDNINCLDTLVYDYLCLLYSLACFIISFMNTLIF